MKVNGKDYPIYYGKNKKSLKPPARLKIYTINPTKRAVIFPTFDDHWAPSGQDRLDGTRLSNTNSEESRRLQRRDLLWRQGWGFDGGFLGWFIMVYGNRMVGLWESCGGFYGV